MTLAMLALTLSLGFWQVRRLHWKQTLLAEIEQGEAEVPVPLGPDPRPFSRVSVTGTYRPVSAWYGSDVRTAREGAVMGAQVLTVLDRPGGLPVVVDRGWTPSGMEAPPPVGPVQVVGYIRPPEPSSWSSAKDDPGARRFYSLDPAVIGTVLGAAQVAPFTLVLLGSSGGLPDPARSLPRPPNDHLTYAITWFGLSAVLISIFVLFVRQAIRKEAAS